ncbi:MAG: NADH-quinone oxidoreductase subunit N [Firmicutes bacterium]|nr:NADH-quinone oxidoreductase subunit N [Bacillota bacterium]
MNFAILWPEIITSGVGVLVLAVGLLAKGETLQRSRAAAWVGVLATVAAALAAWNLQGRNLTAFFGGYRLDDLAVFFKIVVLLAAGMTLLFAPDFLVRHFVRPSDFTALVLFGVTGMMLLASALDFITLYISLELISLSFYALIAIQKGEVRPAEAGLKYLLLSSLASAVMLYGMSLIYGLTGSTYLEAIPKAFGSGQWPLLAGVGVLFILAGLGLKVYLVPFHMWAPDVYEGAPVPTVAFLATGSSAATLAVILRLFEGSFAAAGGVWVPVLLVLAIVTMGVGNLMALPQTNIKRLLAYSSIAHAGYILLAVAAGGSSGAAAVMYYTLLYAVSTIAAFAVVSVYSQAAGSSDIQDLAGLARRSPFLSFVMLAAFASLAGVPPLAGFMAKFTVFAAAVEAGLLVPAGLGLVISVISIYYYFQVIRVMYVSEPRESTPLTFGWGTRVALLLGLAGILLLGVFPGPALHMAQTAVAAGLF